MYVNIVYGNLKSENSQDYAQKSQRTCTFMNSASGGVAAFLTSCAEEDTVSKHNLPVNTGRNNLLSRRYCSFSNKEKTYFFSLFYILFYSFYDLDEQETEWTTEEEEAAGRSSLPREELGRHKRRRARRQERRPAWRQAAGQPRLLARITRFFS